VPFKAIIDRGIVIMKSPNPNVPEVVIPDINASSCGLVSLPSLDGTITTNDVSVSAVNIYVGAPQSNPNFYVTGSALEAIPASVEFSSTLDADLSPVAASNGGLNASLQGNTTAAVSTLGMTCGLVLNALFSTANSGGQPITGPTEAGQAVVASNHFAVPVVATSGTCPAPIAATFNKLLGLPAPAGEGTFKAPFCFDFELEGPNNPADAPVPNPNCPWPSA
jgi:hypothetical protein